MLRALSIFAAVATLLAAGASAFGNTPSPLTRFTPFALPANEHIMDVALTRDGNEMYVTRVDGKRYTIVHSIRRANAWSMPETVSFSGLWRDLEEVISPDGNTMIFSSNRPADADGTALAAFYNGRYTPGGGGNLWVVQRSNGVWGKPQRLPSAVNANTSTFSPTLAQDGTLYFMRASGSHGSFNIYASKRERGTYRWSALAPFSDVRYQDFDPTVAPDDSFVIFSSTRPPAPHHSADLFISFHGANGWNTPRDLGASVNPSHHAVEARLSPDLKTLYYTSGGQVWSIGMP